MRHPIFLFIFLLASCGYAQDKSKQTVDYSFNNASLKNSIDQSIAKGSGIAFTEDRFGNPNFAVYLQGNPDTYINLGTGSSVKLKRGSISLWVLIDQGLHKGKGIMQNPILFVRTKEEENCNEGFFIGYHLDLEKINVNTSHPSGKQISLYPSKKTSLREWHHIVMTYDNDSLNFYLDGALQDRAGKNFESEFLANDSVMVGSRLSEKNQRFLNGSIDDIAFYNYRLSGDEVRKLYNAPDPNFSRRVMKYVGFLLAVIALLFQISFYFQYRLERAVQVQKQKLELRYKWAEMENKVLSAQMDPHFIFNCLNSIQQFIITQQNDKAQEYLSKFSKLFRMVLETNAKESVLLYEEIEILNKYLEIESLRFSQVVDYEIIVSEEINIIKTKIPHFLIQPLVENAIWHGLLPKDGYKLLQITFNAVGEKLLVCTVKDNGVGRLAAEKKESQMKKESLAIKFIQQRLEILGKTKELDCALNFRDEYDKAGLACGTTVVIKMPIL